MSSKNTKSIVAFFTLLFLLTKMVSSQEAPAPEGNLSKVEQAELDALERGEKLDREKNQLLIKDSSVQENTYSEMTDSDQDIVIRHMDKELGIYSEDYTTSTDRHRFGLNYHFNSDLKSAFDLSTFEGNYAYRLGVAWLEFSVALSKGKYKEFTRLNTSIAAETDEQRDQAVSNLGLGTGLSYRTRYIRELIDSDNIFETIAAYLTYNSFSDNFRAESYTGYGIKADFGVHKRTSASTHWGAKLSYNLANVKKEKAFESESTSARSLTITWLTFGLDYSFYF